MNKITMLGVIGGSLLSVAPFSLEWSPQNFGLALDNAQARIGRPLTPFSVAGVSRRAYRRAAVYGGVGYGVGSYYGSGYGAQPYYTSGYAYPTSSYYTPQSYSSYYTPQSYGGYYGGYYGRPVVGARGVARRTARRAVRGNF